MNISSALQYIQHINISTYQYINISSALRYISLKPMSIKEIMCMGLLDRIWVSQKNVKLTPSHHRCHHHCHPHHLGLQLCHGWSLLRTPSATQVMYEIWQLLGKARFNLVACNNRRKLCEKNKRKS